MPIDSTGPEKAFVDTNIFAYAEDLREPVKRPIALSIIRQLSTESRLAISTQVVNEFCAILLRRKVAGITNEGDLISLIAEMEASAEIVVITTAITRDAIRGFYVHSLSWYDALIWAAVEKEAARNTG